MPEDAGGLKAARLAVDSSWLTCAAARGYVFACGVG